jgi:hypothetical protein
LVSAVRPERQRIGGVSFTCFVKKRQRNLLLPAP